MELRSYLNHQQMGTLNTKGIRNKPKRNLVFKSFLTSNIPFMILTETNLDYESTEEIEKYLRRYDVQPFLSNGVMVLVKKGPEIISFNRSNRIVSIILKSQV